MLVQLAPSTAQIRYYAEAALAGFADLDDATAIENAQSELRAMLQYLDDLSSADNPIPILGLSVVNGGGRLELVCRGADCHDPANLKVVGR